MAENVVIKELLDNPFSMRPIHDKGRIVNKDRHISPLLNVITHHKTKTEPYTRLSLLLHRAFCRITLIITPTNALT